MKPCWLILPAGPVPYAEALAAMRDLADRRAADKIPDTLVLLQHPPVYTAGRLTDPAHVLWAEERMRLAGASFHRVDRGGSVTFHGPGQLVGYPILDLGQRPDVVAYLNRLEETIIRAGKDARVELRRDPIQAGVWSGTAKVCAIGVRVARWRVTLHGFGLNCDTDLSWFDAIVPCGLADRTVTSLSEAGGRTITVEEMAPLVQTRFQETFGYGLEPAPVEIAGAFPSIQGARY